LSGSTAWQGSTGIVLSLLFSASPEGGGDFSPGPRGRRVQVIPLTAGTATSSIAGRVGEPRTQRTPEERTMFAK